MQKLWIVFFSYAIVFIACNNAEQKEIKNKDKYEKSKLSLAEIEQQSPMRFLMVSGNDKKNLVGQTVVKGKVTSSAKIISYKDVGIKLSFYSKTGALLEVDQEVVYETIAPGTSVSFKSKYFTPKGTDSVAIKIVSAKY